MKTYRSKVAYVYTGLLFSILSWGMMPIFQKILLSRFSPVEVSFSRFLLSGMIFMLFVLITNRRELYSLITEDTKLLIAGTILGPFLAMILLNYGIKSIPVGIAGVIFTMEAVFTYIFAVFLKQEKWQVKRMLSILLAVTGVFIVSVSKFTGEIYLFGLISVFLCELVWALNTVISKEIVDKYSPVVMISANFFLSSLFLTPFMTSDFWIRFVTMDSKLWVALSFCIFPCTVFGFSVWYWCLKYVPPSTIAVSLYTLPFITIGGGILFLGESISFTMFLGIILTFYGLYLVNFRYK